MSSFEFAGLVLDLQRGRLRRRDQDVALRPKSLAVLTYFVKNPGRVIGKEELIAAVWPNVAATDDTLSQCLTDIRRTLGPEAGGLIRTVPRRGYILDELRVRPKVDDFNTPPFRASTAAAKPSIAVLPFDSFSGDERWQRIADGIVEEIITDLVRHGEIAVIARHSTFAFKGKLADLREIGRSLGAGYLLAGSVQASRRRLRVNVQLVDAESGAHLWATRLEGPEDDLFELEDAIVETVAGALCGLAGAVVRAELGRLGRRHPASLEAFELFLLGHEKEATFTREGTLEGIDLLQRCLHLDPTLARAWLLLAYCWEHMHAFGWHTEADSQQERRHAILKAAEFDPQDPLIKIEFGDILFDDGDHAAARSAYEQALAASWTNADAMALIAKYVGCLLGRPGEARELMDRAFRLNPYAPSWYYLNKLRVCYFAGDHAAAIEAAHRSPETPWRRLFEALSLAALGQTEDADRMVAEMRALYPTYDPESVACFSWLQGATALRQYEEGLRQLGIGAAM